MGYVADDRMVRVDFFVFGVAEKTGRPYQKWKYNEGVKWTGGWKKECGLIHDQFAQSLRDHLRQEDGHWRMSGLVAICLEPYHEHSHPIALAVDNAQEITEPDMV